MASAGFINGGFESGDLSNWGSLGSAQASSGMDYGFAGAVLPDSGNWAAQLMAGAADPASIAQQMSIDLGTLNASNEETIAGNGTLIWQSVFASAGEVLRFRWNFVGYDDLPFDDWAFYGVQFESGATAITRLASVGTVGSALGTVVISGWTTLQVPITQTGNYTIYFGVLNGADNLFPSEFWLDGAESEVPEPATLALLLPAMAAMFLFRRQTRVSR